MTVSKPLEKKKPTIDELIDRGAPVKADIKRVREQKTNLNLLIPVKLLQDIEQAMQELVGISRTGWILQAIHEKLKRKE